MLMLPEIGLSCFVLCIYSDQLRHVFPVSMHALKRIWNQHAFLGIDLVSQGRKFGVNPDRLNHILRDALSSHLIFPNKEVVIHEHNNGKNSE